MGVIGPMAMGPMGNWHLFVYKIINTGWMCQNVKRCQVVKKMSNVKKMSSCQKDVKCQKIKDLDYGGGSQKK